MTNIASFLSGDTCCPGDSCIASPMQCVGHPTTFDGRSASVYTPSNLRERARMHSRLTSVVPFIFSGLIVACTSPRERARADSAQALVAQQGLLVQRLTAQRDSVSRVL